MTRRPENLAQRFEEDGYLILESLFPQAGLAEIERELDRYLRETAPGVPGGDIVYEPDGEAIRNLWRMEAHDPYFAELASDRALQGLAAQLLPAPSVLVVVELFAKPARVGSATPYHQDNAYFNLAPPEALTIWVALDDSTRQNGCMRFVPGSHRKGRLPHGPSGISGNSQAARLEPDLALAERPAVIPRGGCSIHHCLTLHRSEPNGSDYPRRALLFVYRSDRARVDTETAVRYQAELQLATAGGTER